MHKYYCKGNNPQRKNKWSLWMEKVLYKYKECCLVGCLVINLIVTTFICSKRNYREGRIFRTERTVHPASDKRAWETYQIGPTGQIGSS